MNQQDVFAEVRRLRPQANDIPIFVVCSAERRFFLAQWNVGARELGMRVTDIRLAHFFFDIREARSYLEGRKNWRVVEVGFLTLKRGGKI